MQWIFWMVSQMWSLKSKSGMFLSFFMLVLAPPPYQVVWCAVVHKKTAAHVLSVLGFNRTKIKILDGLVFINLGKWFYRGK